MRTLIFVALSLGFYHGGAGDASGGFLELRVTYEQRVKEVEEVHATRTATLGEGYSRAPALAL